MDTVSLKDWVSALIEKEAYVKPEKGTRKRLDMDRLLKLAETNGCDVEKYAGEMSPSEAGRVRMSVGNMLRNVARKSGKIKGLNGRNSNVPKELTAEAA